MHCVDEDRGRSAASVRGPAVVGSDCADLVTATSHDRYNTAMLMYAHNDGLPADVGFRSGPKGTQTSRTIMLAELRQLLDAVGPEAGRSDYLDAIVIENVLAKQTTSNRRISAQRLSELYALDPDTILFSALRQLWAVDEPARPLLACLCANARDPLLRTTGAFVLQAAEGAVVTKADLAEAVEQAWPDRFNPSILEKIGRNAASSWTQSGHLVGRSRKARTRVTATPSAAAYAALLGRLQGLGARQLLDSYWAALLDCNTSTLDALLFQASRRGWMEYRRVGDVLQVGFEWLLGERGV